MIIIKIMNGICRTCLSEPTEKEFVNIVNEMIGDVSVLELIIKFTSVKLLTGDPLPQVVCCICLEKLQFVHTFCQSIVSSDTILKRRLSEDKYLNINNIDGDRENKSIPANDDYKNHSIEGFNGLGADCTSGNTTTSIKEKDIDESKTSKFIINNLDVSFKNARDTKRESNLEGAVLKEPENRKRMYECEECKKLFKKADHYKVHMTTHTGEKKYAYEFCPKKFARSYVLVYHRRVHTGEKPYTCDICSKSFSSPSNFYIHKKIHSGEKNYKCKLCDDSFIQSDSLKIHIRRMHTGERPYLCEICSSAFRSNSSLLTHKLDMHGVKEACPLCNKSYSVRVLKEHIRRHKEKEQGIKRYACDQCGKRFTCSSSRKKHLLIHSGEKPYSCEICEKSFNQRSALKTHMRIHSDFMLFHCDFCPKSFRYKHHLMSHNNTHHKDILKEGNGEK